jgi:putative membrane protein
VNNTREHLALLGAVVAILIVSGIGPRDRLTWVLEAMPVIIAVPLLAATYRRFRLTSLLYRLLVLHAIILLVGGHYTYAEVPAGFWVSDLLGLTRNHYDRLGHFAQGFVPAIIAREILLRRTPLKPGAWLSFLVVCVCLAFSALYELIEWWSALVLGQDADAFLGTQGDPWDTQWDMFMALIGAIVAQLALGKTHDRALSKLRGETV